MPRTRIPYYRKYKTRAGKRTQYVKHARMRIPRPIGKQNHMFRFNQSLGQVTSVTSPGYASGSLVFKLGQVIDHAHLQGLFDQFRIRKVVVDFVPRRTSQVITSVDTSAINVLSIPMFVTCIDLDSDQVPTSLNQLREYSTRKETPATKKHSWILKPAILTENYRSLTTTSYSPKVDQWLDTIHDDVPHRGVRYFMEGDTVNPGRYQYEIMATYYIECKNVR